MVDNKPTEAYSRADFRKLGDELDKSTILFLVVVEYL